MFPGAFNQAMQLLPALVMGLAVLGYFLRHQWVCRQQLQGVLCLQAMRVFLTHLQKHRGLSAGIISGDRSLLPQLAEVQHLISRDLVHITSLGDGVKDNANWQAVTAHWARLVGRLNSTGLFNCIDQHNRLIKNILVFIEDIAAEHYLTNNYRGAPNNWRELLEMAESVGQVRALGTALAAGGEHFEFALKTRAELIQVMLHLQDSVEKTPLPVAQQFAINTLLTYIKSRILVSDHASAQEFFACATECLDNILMAFDSEINRVHLKLAPRRAV